MPVDRLLSARLHHKHVRCSQNFEVEIKIKADIKDGILKCRSLVAKFQPSLSTLLQLVLFSTCLADRGRILSQRQCFAYTYCRRNYHRSSSKYWMLNINHGSQCEQGHLRRDWYDPITRWSPVSVIIFGILPFLPFSCVTDNPHETEFLWAAHVGIEA